MNQVFTVIDTISINEGTRERYPDLVQKYSSNGVVAILEPSIDSLFTLSPGHWVKITTPDGANRELPIEFGEMTHGAFSIFFADISQSEIPRNSIIEI